MALFPQFPYGNLHELNLDWLIENISQLLKDGTVISVNGMSGRVTLYTEKDVVFPSRAFDENWSVYRRIADKMAGLQFTGEKFFYITKNVDDEDFTIQEVFTSNNPPPYPVISINGRTGAVIVAGDNTPYNMDGVDTIEDVVTNIQKAIGPVVQYNTCSVGVTAGQYVYLFMSGIAGRTDGIYKAANNKAANTTWTSADLIPGAAGIGGVLANNENSINTLNTRTENIIPQKIIRSVDVETIKTLNVPNSARFMLDFISNNVNGSFSINVLSTTAGVVSVQEKVKGSDVTFDTSVAGKLTINLATGRGGYFFVQAAGNGMLNDITLA